MQAGEIIWFLAGIGAGLTLAIVIFAAVAVADSRRARRQLDAAGDWAGVDAAPIERDERPRVQMHVREPVAPSGPLSNLPPERVARSKPRPINSERRNLASSAVVEDETMSTLAAEISRMHSSGAVTVDVEPARPVQSVQMPPEPDRVAQTVPQLVVRAAPAPTVKPHAEPVVAATVETAAAPTPVKTAPPPLELEVASLPVEAEANPASEEPPRPAKPAVSKLPPLPRVAPARKFAPALPPRTPPVSGAKT